MSAPRGDTLTDLIEVKTSNLVDEPLAGVRPLLRRSQRARYPVQSARELGTGRLKIKVTDQLSEVLIRCLDEISFCASFARRRP